MANMVLPRVQAMVLCDEVEESDQEPEVVHLTGVRAGIESPVFPLVVPQLCVFMQMSGHQSEAHCHIEIEHPTTGEVIAETESRAVAFEDPASVLAVYFRLPNCVFPEPGLYYVQVMQGEKLIGERPLHLTLEE